SANAIRIKSVHALDKVVGKKAEVELKKELIQLEGAVATMWTIVAKTYSKTIDTMERIFPAE
ncbi:MAG: hypothetical protein O7B26_13900, partial [Planctomycetota bacterium]|nr:hypothetical protein [Planctomycetota bacterium]